MTVEQPAACRRGRRRVAHQRATYEDFLKPRNTRSRGTTSTATQLHRRRKWDDCFKYWHYARPFIGAAIGSLGALLFFVLSDTATTGPGQPALNATVFNAVAFLVGYREQSFRELIKRATDLFLKPADSAAPQSSAGGTNTTTR